MSTAKTNADIAYAEEHAKLLDGLVKLQQRVKHFKHRRVHAHWGHVGSLEYVNHVIAELLSDVPIIPD